MAEIQLKCVLLSFLLAKVCSMSAESEDCSLQFLVNYTRYLTKSNALQTVVVLRDDGVRSCDLERILQEELQLPLITGNALNTQQLYQIIGHNSFAIVLQRHISDYIRHTADIVLRKRHDIPILFSISTPPSSEELSEFFLWCWQINAIKVVLIHRTSVSHEVFTYTPFPTIQIFNRTSAALSTFRWPKKMNLNGYHFEVEFFNEPPMVFGPRNTTKKVVGMAGKLFTTFMERLNATYSIRVVSITNRTEKTREHQIILMPSRNLMDIGVNALMSVNEYANETETSYPIAQTKACVIVPFVREAPRTSYFLQVFGAKSWCALVGILLVFVGMQIFLNRTQRDFHSLEFGLAVIWALNTLLYQPLSALTVPSGAYRVMLIAFALFGLVITNIYIGSLASLLSVTIPGPKIKTVQDLINSQLKILLITYDRGMYFSSGLLPSELESILVDSSASNVVGLRTRLNTSYAYVVPSEKWRTIEYQQQYLWKPIFRIASEELCTPVVPQSLALQHDSPFYEQLQIFTMEAQQFGLMERWMEEAHMYLRERKLIYLLQEKSERLVALTNSHLTYVYRLYYTCILICLACFVGEHLTLRLQQRRPARTREGQRSRN